MSGVFWKALSKNLQSGPKLRYEFVLVLFCNLFISPELLCLLFSHRRRCLRERWTVRFKDHIWPLQKDDEKPFQGYLMICLILFIYFFGRCKVVHVFGIFARERISKTEMDNWNFATKCDLLITVILTSRCYYSLECFCIPFAFLLFQSSLPKLLSDSLPSSLPFPIPRSNSCGSGG